MFDGSNYQNANRTSPLLNFIAVNADEDCSAIIAFLQNNTNFVPCIFSNEVNAMQQCRMFFIELMQQKITNPVVIAVESNAVTIDEQLINFSVVSGGLFLDGLGDGIWLINNPEKLENIGMKGRTYLPMENNHRFLNNTSFSILQAVRTRISKTEFISCPSCGRTLFDLQETTAKIRAVTQHLKGLKIAIMGCIVNGPGEMADADFGYVGSGPGKITLYKGKKVVKKNINSDIAVQELINLLKENEVWIDAETQVKMQL